MTEFCGQLKEELEKLIKELSEELGVVEDLLTLSYETLDTVAIYRGRRSYSYLRGVKGQERKTLARIETMTQREMAFRLVHAYRALCHLEHLEENLLLCGLQAPVHCP